MKLGEDVEGSSSALLSRFNALPKEEQIRLLSSLLLLTQKKHNLSPTTLLGASETLIPFGIFSQNKISSLESIVKYLKESLGLKFSKIARLLGRSQKTIWATYSVACKKMPEPFSDVRDSIFMPASLISDRSLSVLEHVVCFAKDLGNTNHEIALLLHLDDRTIWAVYDKVKKKRGIS